MPKPSAALREKLYKILEFTKAFFAEHNITWWLDYGTLLGAVREGKLINHDDDADIGILAKDLGKLRKLGGTIKKKGFQLWTAPNPHWKKELLRIVYRGAYMHIFVWHEREDGTMHRVSYSHKDRIAKKGKSFDRSLIEPLDEIQLNGVLYPCPQKAEEFVAFRYGADWKIPKSRGKGYKG